MNCRSCIYVRRCMDRSRNVPCRAYVRNESGNEEYYRELLIKEGVLREHEEETGNDPDRPFSRHM